ncbi:flagellar protein FlgN [bacterium SCSIO 12696]|nr:flagellar protein FlgN [bacterium SCSIO 12696]
MANTPVVNTQQLQHILQQELEFTLQLQQSLAKERQAIEQQDPESLANTAQHKGQLVQQLEQIAKQRESLLVQGGVPVSREGMQQLLSASNDTALETAWQQLSEAAQQCREDNRQLGMLVRREQDNVRQAQHILQRGTPSDNHSYNASGQSASSNTSRNIGKA